MNPIDRSATLIANKRFRFGGKAYQPGDRFNWKSLGHAQRRKVVRLIEGPERKLVELTMETFKVAMKRREKTARPPRGFTIAGLLGLGIVSMDQIKAFGWANIDFDKESVGEENWVPTEEGCWRVFSEGKTEEQSTDDTTLWIVPMRARGVPRYYVHDLDGTRLSGDASINGKSNAEAWARDYMVDRARRREAAAGAMPDWSAFDANPENWTDDQVEVFSVWFDDLPEDETVYDLPAGVALAFKDRRDAVQEENDRLARENEKPLFDGMSRNEAIDFVGGLSDEDLRVLLSSAQEKNVTEFEGLTRAALDDIATDLIEERVAATTEGTQDDSNLQPVADDAEG